MAQYEPILARDKSAAKLLDMSLTEFRQLVDQGALPPAGKFGRWVVADLKNIASGEAAFDDSGLDL